jgi:hypothetical protein
MIAREAKVVSRKPDTRVLPGALWILAITACSNSPNAHPPADWIQPSGGADSAVDGPGSDNSEAGNAADALPGDDGVADAPTGTDASDAASDALAQGAADAQVTPPNDAPMTEPLCNPGAKWSDPQPVAGIPTFATQPLITVTSDELSIAWVVAANGGQGSVSVADRSSRAAAFGSPVALVPFVFGPTPDGGGPPVGPSGSNAYFAFERVALTGDGLRLIGVAVGGLHMAQFGRSNRGDAFNPQPQEADLEGLSRSLSAGEHLGDPVISNDGKDLVYSHYGNNQATSVWETFLPAGQSTWPNGIPSYGPPLMMSANGARKRPTSLSADRLTLFVWDDGSAGAFGVFRGSSMGTFNAMQSAGARFSVQASGDCTSLYFVAQLPSGYVVEQVTTM